MPLTLHGSPLFLNGFLSLFLLSAFVLLHVSWPSKLPATYPALHCLRCIVVGGCCGPWWCLLTSALESSCGVLVLQLWWNIYEQQTLLCTSAHRLCISLSLSVHVLVLLSYLCLALLTSLLNNLLQMVPRLFQLLVFSSFVAAPGDFLPPCCMSHTTASYLVLHYTCIMCLLQSS